MSRRRRPTRFASVDDPPPSTAARGSLDAAPHGAAERHALQGSRGSSPSAVLHRSHSCPDALLPERQLSASPSDLHAMLTPRSRPSASRSSSTRARSAKALASVRQSKKQALMRTRRFSPGEDSPASHRAVLEVLTPLDSMCGGWEDEELRVGRRLVRFRRVQEGFRIKLSCEGIKQEEYVEGDTVISCIYRRDTESCFVTSVDIISLLEGIVGEAFEIEEKNRIRRNLEGFRPKTVSKNRAGSESFFQQIMDFPAPKPRNIEKDVKVFEWGILPQALEKIISKYVRCCLSAIRALCSPPPPPRSRYITPPTRATVCHRHRAPTSRCTPGHRGASRGSTPRARLPPTSPRSPATTRTSSRPTTWTQPTGPTARAPRCITRCPTPRARRWARTPPCSSRPRWRACPRPPGTTQTPRRPPSTASTAWCPPRRPRRSRRRRPRSRTWRCRPRTSFPRGQLPPDGGSHPLTRPLLLTASSVVPHVYPTLPLVLLYHAPVC